MNPELKFLRLDYWGGHVSWDGTDGPYSPCLLLNITDVLYVESNITTDGVYVFFRQGTPSLTKGRQYLNVPLVGPQTDNNVTLWLQEQIRNAYESDSAIYYPPSQPPVLFNTDFSGYINAG
jgi:hypothetical protein